jgi:hypothetical protein
MRSYREFLNDAKSTSSSKKESGSTSSSRVKCMQALVQALRKTLSDFDMPTRKFVWEHLTTPKGEQLMNQILRNPKTYMSNSEFTKLVNK